MSEKTKQTVFKFFVFLLLFMPIMGMINYYLNYTSEIIVLAGNPTPTITPTPTKSIEKPVPVETDIVVKVSHYSPALGGVNCARFVDGKCVSKLANGEDWEKYINTKSVIACPPELKLGTKIKILGRVWTCKDRGSKITKTEEGKYWVDQLVTDTPVPYGFETEAQIIYIP